jgi:uncharacterized protein YbjT (DUF2867 family)
MIFVTGGTGTVGSALMPRLMDRGAAVRALAHSTSSRTRLEELGAEVVDGDLDEPEKLEEVMAGCDHLFLLTPVSPTQAAREKAVVDAARRAGVAHVVAASVIGAHPSSQIGFGRAHAEVDDHLASSGLGYTILRPTGFMQSHLWPVQTVVSEGRWYGMTGDGASAFIDADDMAEAAAQVLTTSGHEGATYELTGPQAISMREAAATLAEVIQRPVSYLDLEPDAFGDALTGAGVPGLLAEDLKAMYQTIRAGHAATVSNSFAEVTGRPARSYRDFAVEHRAEMTAQK